MGPAEPGGVPTEACRSRTGVIVTPVAKVPNPLRRRPRVALVLAGGGNLGAIQVGQLRAIAERGIVPDLIVGCSAGAMNGVGFAREPNLIGVQRLEGVWRRFMEDRDLVLPGSWLPSPIQLLRKGESMTTSANMERSLREFLGPARTFEELVVPFQCVATDVEANSERWFHSGDLVAPILASAALPSVFPMVMIDGRRYMDGGVLNNVPINRAVELGATEIYVLHMGLHGKPSHTIRRPLDAAMVAYWIARNGRFARDLATLPPNVEAHVLPPGPRPDLKFNDFSRSEELMEQGYRNAVEYFVEQDMHVGETSAARLERLRRQTRRVLDELRGRVQGLRASVGTIEPVEFDEYAELDLGDERGSGRADDESDENDQQVRWPGLA